MKRAHVIVLGAVAVLGLAATGCQSQAQASEADIAETTAAIGSGNAGIGHAPPGIPFGRGLEGLHGDGSGPWARCDDTPEETTQEVCGQSLLATRKLAWTGCERGGPGGGGGHPGGPPPPGADAGMARPPPPAHRSDGTVDETQTVTLVCGEPCAADAVYRFETTRTLQVTLSGSDGSGSERGTVRTVSERTLAAAQYSVTETRDVTHTRQRTGEAAVESHVTGSLTRAVDTAARSVVESGTHTRVGPEGTRTTRLQEVTRGDPTVCRFPTAGTLTDTAEDGTVTTTVFQSTCGTALVNGEQVQLPSRGGPGMGHGGHPGGPPPPRP